MARQENIYIDQGADFSIEVDVQDENGDTLDLTGYTARAKMRKHHAANTSYDFTCTIDDDLIVLELTHVETDEIPPGRYVYDVEIVSGANLVHRVVQGIATVNPSATY